MLEQQGLIEMKPNRSAVVVGITKQDVEDIYNIRTHVEGLAAARAAENRSEEQLRSLQELCDLQSFYREKGSAVRMNELDSHFHEELYKCCQSRQLELFLQDLHRKISRFRHLSINSEERAGKMLAEHEAILDAIREQNSRLAEELMIKHITNAKDNLLKLLSEQEDKENG